MAIPPNIGKSVLDDEFETHKPGFDLMKLLGSTTGTPESRSQLGSFLGGVSQAISPEGSKAARLGALGSTIAKKSATARVSKKMSENIKREEDPYKGIAASDLALADNKTVSNLLFTYDVGRRNAETSRRRLTDVEIPVAGAQVAESEARTAEIDERAKKLGLEVEALRKAADEGVLVMSPQGVPYNSKTGVVYTPKGGTVIDKITSSNKEFTRYKMQQEKSIFEDETTRNRADKEARIKMHSDLTTEFYSSDMKTRSLLSSLNVADLPTDEQVFVNAAKRATKYLRYQELLSEGKMEEALAVLDGDEEGGGGGASSLSDRVDRYTQKVSDAATEELDRQKQAETLGD